MKISWKWEKTFYLLEEKPHEESSSASWTGENRCDYDDLFWNFLLAGVASFIIFTRNKMATFDNTKIW